MLETAAERDPRAPAGQRMPWQPLLLALAMPARLALDAGATRQAQALLAGVRRAAAGSPSAVAHRCRTVTTGSSGPLAAPYQACATWTSRWHFVLFTKTGADGGTGYTNAGAANFEDQCYRHLTGRWWAYTRDASGTGDCPFGYSFHGGG